MQVFTFKRMLKNQLRNLVLLKLNSITYKIKVLFSIHTKSNSSKCHVICMLLLKLSGKINSYCCCVRNYRARTLYRMPRFFFVSSVNCNFTSEGRCSTPSIMVSLKLKTIVLLFSFVCRLSPLTHVPVTF